MQFKAILRGAVVVGVIAFTGAGAALAQGCAETQFSAKTGQTYLDAEQAAMVNKDLATAASKLAQLRSQPLNCYEEGAVLRLGAFIKLEQGDRRGAVQDLLGLINKGFISADQIAGTYYNIAQIYLQEEDLKQALEYMNKWQQAGGKPDRTQKWQMAVLSQRAGNNRDAIKWAEEVRRDDGSKFDQQLYDLLVYLYNDTGQKAKLAEVLEILLERNPADRKYWDAIAGNYFADNEERKAFEVQKAMYLGGLLKTEDEIMRIVNFYNRFNAPFHAARILEKEMNAGRIKKNLERLELLANLYQVAREHEKAIPVIRQAASAGGGGAMYERLGRSYADLQKWKEAEDALLEAMKLGGVKDKGNAWVQIGQSRFERNDRAGAREAFRTAGNQAGRSWLDFMNSEEETKAALVCFGVQSTLLNIQNEQKLCKRIEVVGADQLPENCKTAAARLEEAEAKFNATPECASQRS